MGDPRRNSYKPKRISKKKLDQITGLKAKSLARNNGLVRTPPSSPRKPRVSRIVPSPTKVKIDFLKKYDSVTRQNRRLKAKVVVLEDDKTKHLRMIQDLLDRAADARRREGKLREEVDELKKALDGSKEACRAWRDRYRQMKQKNRVLEKKINRATGALSRAMHDVKNSPRTWKMWQKGRFSPEARALARELVQNGCAREKVGETMYAVAKSLGVNLPRKMSRRTVGRVVLEGKIAAHMQLAYEMSLNKAGFTVSQDSTSNRKINFEAQHVALRAPDYTAGKVNIDPKSTPVLRLVSVDSTLDHTSARSVEGWEKHTNQNNNIFNRSPLAQRLKRQYTLLQFYLDLLGLSGDHAANEKLTAKLLEAKKKGAIFTHLGQEELRRKPAADLIAYLLFWNAKKIEDAGGIDAWNALTKEEQAHRDSRLFDEIIDSLGRDAYASLQDDERRQIDLFIWTGCCMHKDMNAFKAGNEEMMGEWERLKLTPPIVLANKANAAILKRHAEPNVKSIEEMSDAEAAALEASTRGAVKACSLAGMLFNNKDDKKGQGDTHVNYFKEHLGEDHSRFPDTSNLRFGTFGLASAELYTFRDEYSTFIENIRLNKSNPGLTNPELNLRNALKDPPTLAEFCAIILVDNAVHFPYRRVIRGLSGELVNALHLGPLHREVAKHVQDLLDDPELLVSSNASYEHATMDGKPWHNPKAVQEVLDALPLIPYVKEMTVAFLRGSLPSWIRFSSEHAPGGPIDTLTSDEKDRAWMPATNDHNEGALGSYRVNALFKMLS